MTDKLPEIQFPNQPISPEWGEAVSQLLERTKIVTQWGQEIHQRAQFSVGVYQKIILELDRAYQMQNHQKVERVLEEARQTIEAQRNGRSDLMN